ncbi:hypothetical protein DYB30_013092 [Aphanomyces astaci]|uniref:Uncharacterized protein n=1 Tax=Aphanomyces astaci TaxID=112090 RepID=A0A397E3N6_APHAT|nr:hypothetical protein DYB30_013092 [Aphanomyces astaci]
MCLNPVLGSRAYQARRQELLRLVSTDAVLGDRDMIHRNHAERYAKSLEKSQAYVTLLERHEIVDPDEQTFVYQVIGEPLPIDVHRAINLPKVTPATDLNADAMTELKQLKLMLLAQKQELDDLQPTESAKPNGLRAHFSAFKVKFQNVCQLRHIWDIIDGSYVLDYDAAEVEAFEYEDKANLDKSYLQTSLSNEVFDMIREVSSSAEMWRTLVSNYETKEWSNTIYVLRRLCSLRCHPKTDMRKHITRVRATIRELVDMGKAMTESEVVDALLNEEEKRRERKRGNRHEERYDRPRDAERQRKRTYEAKGIEDMTLEINALQTRLTELSDKRCKTDDGLLWCYICKKKGDHEAKEHPGYDPNYAKKRAGGGRQSQRGTHGGKSRPRPTSDGSDSDSDAAQYHVNSVTVDDTRQVMENHWTLDNCATGHVTGNHHFMHSWKGTSSLILPNQAVVKGRRGTAKIHLLRNGEHATLKLHDVTYEPTIYKNLISHVRLLRSGYQRAHQDLKRTTYVHRFNGHELHFALSDSLYVLQDVVPRAAAERINATTLATDKALDPPSDAKLRH